MIITQAINLHDRLVDAYNDSVARLTGHAFWGEEEEIAYEDRRSDRLLDLIARAADRVVRRERETDA